jgi:hypothetical protein
MANSGVKSTTMVHEMVMMLFFSPSCVVTRTTGPDSISVNALPSFILFITARPIPCVSLCMSGSAASAF